MGSNALLLSLATLTLLAFLVAACALVAWKRACRSTRSPKRSPSEPPTQSSDAVLAQLMADQASLYSTLEKLTTTVKRLSSRNGMRELRERDENPGEPPVGSDKVTLLRHYGMSGKVGPAFAQAQLSLEARRQEK